MTARLKDDARNAGIGVIRLDLWGLADDAALGDYLATASMFAHRTRGLDAAIDLISNGSGTRMATSWWLTVWIRPRMSLSRVLASCRSARKPGPKC